MNESLSNQKEAGVLGRFISRDPIGHRGGLNLYAYPTNPVRFVDPAGLKIEVSDPEIAAALDVIGADPVYGSIVKDLNDMDQNYILDFDGPNYGNSLGGIKEAGTGNLRTGELITVLSPYARNLEGLKFLIAHEIIHAWIGANARGGKCHVNSASLEEEVYAEKMAQGFFRRHAGKDAKSQLAKFEGSNAIFHGYVESFNLSLYAASQEVWLNFAERHWNTKKREDDRGKLPRACKDLNFLF